MNNSEDPTDEELRAWVSGFTSKAKAGTFQKRKEVSERDLVLHGGEKVGETIVFGPMEGTQLIFRPSKGRYGTDARWIVSLSGSISHYDTQRELSRAGRGLWDKEKEEPHIAFKAARQLLACHAGMKALYDKAKQQGIPAEGDSFLVRTSIEPEDAEIENGSSLFSEDHFVDLSGFVAKLRTLQDPISGYLWNQFSASTQQVLTNVTSTPEQQKVALIQALNSILNGVLIYETVRFAQVALSPETLALKSQDLHGEDLIRLNRLLLEDAYPLEIAKSLDAHPARSRIRWSLYGPRVKEQLDRVSEQLIMAHDAISLTVTALNKKFGNKMQKAFDLLRDGQWPQDIEKLWDHAVMLAGDLQRPPSKKELKERHDPYRRVDPSEFAKLLRHAGLSWLRRES